MVPEFCYLRPYLGIETVSSVEKGGKDGHRLKLEKTGQLFSIFNAQYSAKIAKNVMVSAP